MYYLNLYLFQSTNTYCISNVYILKILYFFRSLIIFICCLCSVHSPVSFHVYTLYDDLLGRLINDSFRSLGLELTQLNDPKSKTIPCSYRSLHSPPTLCFCIYNVFIITDRVHRLLAKPRLAQCV